MFQWAFRSSYRVTDELVTATVQSVITQRKIPILDILHCQIWLEAVVKNIGFDNHANVVLVTERGDSSYHL